MLQTSSHLCQSLSKFFLGSTECDGVDVRVQTRNLHPHSCREDDPEEAREREGGEVGGGGGRERLGEEGETDNRCMKSTQTCTQMHKVGTC